MGIPDMACPDDGLVGLTQRMVTLAHHLIDTTDNNLMERDDDRATVRVTGKWERASALKTS